MSLTFAALVLYTTLSFPLETSMKFGYHETHNLIAKARVTKITFTFLPETTTKRRIKYIKQHFVGHWTSGSEVQWSLRGNNVRPTITPAYCLERGSGPQHREGGSRQSLVYAYVEREIWESGETAVARVCRTELWKGKKFTGEKKIPENCRWFLSRI